MWRFSCNNCNIELNSAAEAAAHLTDHKRGKKSASRQPPTQFESFSDDDIDSQGALKSFLTWDHPLDTSVQYESEEREETAPVLPSVECGVQLVALPPVEEQVESFSDDIDINIGSHGTFRSFMTWDHPLDTSVPYEGSEWKGTAPALPSVDCGVQLGALPPIEEQFESFSDDDIDIDIGTAPVLPSVDCGVQLVALPPIEEQVESFSDDDIDMNMYSNGAFKSFLTWDHSLDTSVQYASQEREETAPVLPSVDYGVQLAALPPIEEQVESFSDDIDINIDSHGALKSFISWYHALLAAPVLPSVKCSVQLAASPSVAERLQTARQHSYGCKFTYDDSFSSFPLDLKIGLLSSHLAFVGKDEPVPDLCALLKDP